MNTTKDAPSYISMDWDSVGIPMNNFITNVSTGSTQVSTKKSPHSLEKRHYMYILGSILFFIILVYFCSKKTTNESNEIPEKIIQISKPKKEKKKHEAFLIQTKLDTKETHEETKEKINEHLEKIHEKIPETNHEKNQEKIPEPVQEKVILTPKKKKIRPATGDDFFYLDQDDSDEVQGTHLDSQFQYKQSPFSAPPLQPAVFL